MTINMPSSTRMTDSSFFLETNTQTFTSPLNRATQKLELPGQRWRFNWSLPKLNRAQYAVWKAFILQLKGRTNTFTASDPDWQNNLGLWTGTPLVKGAGQTGNSLIIDNCTASKSDWGKAGDYFNCGSGLYCLTAPCSTNGSGETTLQFEPPMYTAPADNAPITCNPATVEMTLQIDDAGEWPSDANGTYAAKSFSAVQDL